MLGIIMEGEISKDCVEDIQTCLNCEKLIRFEEGRYTVKFWCTAEDRFDCPHLRRFYKEEELKKIDEWKRHMKVKQKGGNEHRQA
jgi:hypothetical protein